MLNWVAMFTRDSAFSAPLELFSSMVSVLEDAVSTKTTLTESVSVLVASSEEARTVFRKMLDLHARVTSMFGIQDADHALLAAASTVILKAAHAMPLAHLGNLIPTLAREVADKENFGITRRGDASAMAFIMVTNAPAALLMLLSMAEIVSVLLGGTGTEIAMLVDRFVVEPKLGTM